MLWCIWRFVAEERRNAAFGAVSIVLFVFAMFIDWLLETKHSYLFLQVLSTVVGKFTFTGRVLTGPFYIWLGTLFATRFPKRPSLMFSSTITILGGIQYWLFPQTTVCPPVLFYVGVFAFALHIKRLPFPTAGLRKMSSLIYFAHMIPITVLRYFAFKLTVGPILFVASLAISTLLATLWISFKEKQNLYPLRGNP